MLAALSCSLNNLFRRSSSPAWQIEEMISVWNLSVCPAMNNETPRQHVPWGFLFDFF
jgi:hypothetical protein